MHTWEYSTASTKTKGILKPLRHARYSTVRQNARKSFNGIASTAGQSRTNDTPAKRACMMDVETTEKERNSCHFSVITFHLLRLPSRRKHQMRSLYKGISNSWVGKLAVD